MEHIKARDTALASTSALREIVNDGQWLAFIWRDDEPEFEPLLVDGFTANAMLAVRNALNPANQAKFDRMVAKSRGSFGRLFEFTMPRVGKRSET